MTAHCLSIGPWGVFLRAKDVIREARDLYDKMMSYRSGKAGQPSRVGGNLAAKAEGKGQKRSVEAPFEGGVACFGLW